MRIFIGIRLDNSSIQFIDQALKPLKRISTPIKWVQPENLHLTLKFIGEVTEDQLFQIVSVLQKTDYGISPFTLKISGIGKFSRGKTLTVLWAGAETNGELEKLYHSIENNMARISINRETRPFKSHITLGRNRKDFNFSGFYDQMEDSGNSLDFETMVNGFQIFRSDLSQSGPRYTVLKEICFENR